MAEKSKPPAERVVGDSGHFGQMRRDPLELAHGSLFVEKINHASTAANAHLLTGADALSTERASGSHATPFQAAGLLLDRNADGLTVNGALLIPLIWLDLTQPAEVQKHIGRPVAATLQNLSFPFFWRVDNLYCM
jgi:hypothetical protein